MLTVPVLGPEFGVTLVIVSAGTNPIPSTTKPSWLAAMYAKLPEMAMPTAVPLVWYPPRRLGEDGFEMSIT